MSKPRKRRCDAFLGVAKHTPANEQRLDRNVQAT